MSITAWRIVKGKLVTNAFDGQGARRFGGRWNSKGTPMVYTAGSRALAVLETLVHLEAGDLLGSYRLIPVVFAESLIEVLEAGRLPGNWSRRAGPRSIQLIGDEWVASERSVVLRVPSAVVPGESNYLLNVAHPDFGRLVIGRPEVYRFDRRLA